MKEVAVVNNSKRTKILQEETVPLPIQLFIQNMAFTLFFKRISSCYAGVVVFRRALQLVNMISQYLFGFNVNLQHFIELRF